MNDSKILSRHFQKKQNNKKQKKLGKVANDKQLQG